MDENLDWSTFSLLSTSHENRVEIADDKNVSFIFSGIYLPDSTSNEPESHGYIAYGIKSKSSLDIGSVMYNSASIYFDFNEPIHTNTVSTTVVSSEPEVSLFDDFEVDLYPVPVTEFIEIRSDTPIVYSEIIDGLGKVCLVSTNQHLLNVSSLPAGTYFCRFQNNQGQIATRRIVKM